MPQSGLQGECSVNTGFGCIYLLQQYPFFFFFFFSSSSSSCFIVIHHAAPNTGQTCDSVHSKLIPLSTACLRMRFMYKSLASRGQVGRNSIIYRSPAPTSRDVRIGKKSGFPSAPQETFRTTPNTVENLCFTSFHHPNLHPILTSLKFS